MDALIWIAVVLGAAVVLVWFLRGLFERLIVFEYERGLRFHKGRLSGVLEPGQYWLYRRTTSVQKVDIRPRFVSITGQEVLSSDSVSVRVSLAAEFEIVDAAKAITSVEDYENALYLAAQLSLREIVGAAEIDDLLERRGDFGRRLLELTAPRVEEFGLKLKAVEIKDIMFPGPLKRVFARVVEARKEGLAALERARSETAALRNLANAARVVEGNPALMQLRLLQEIGSASGNTIVLGLPGVTTPIPVRPGEEPPTISTREIEGAEED
jgi:regulator of protease activity HflC (stomatin/prohibitin superfamily)